MIPNRKPADLSKYRELLKGNPDMFNQLEKIINSVSGKPSREILDKKTDMHFRNKSRL